MIPLNPWKFGAVIALAVGINYTLCTIVWVSFPGPSIDFLNALFHGLDFRKLQVGSPFPAGSFLYALITLMVFTYVLGAIYALVRNRLKPEAEKA